MIDALMTHDYTLIDLLALGTALGTWAFLLADPLLHWWRRRSIRRVQKGSYVSADPARIHREAMACVDRRLPGLTPPESWPTREGMAARAGAVSGSGSATTRVGANGSEYGSTTSLSVRTTTQTINGRRPHLWLVE